MFLYWRRPRGVLSLLRAMAHSRWTYGALLLAVVSCTHIALWGTWSVTRTVNVVELEWTTSAAVGFVYSVDFPIAARLRPPATPSSRSPPAPPSATMYPPPPSTPPSAAARHVILHL